MLYVKGASPLVTCICENTVWKGKKTKPPELDSNSNILFELSARGAERDIAKPNNCVQVRPHDSIFASSLAIGRVEPCGDYEEDENHDEGDDGAPG